MAASSFNNYVRPQLSSYPHPSLLGIPLEVRLLIYKPVFCGSKIIIIGGDRHRKPKHEYPGGGLLFTCRKIRREALLVDVSSTSLVVDMKLPPRHDFSRSPTYITGRSVPPRYFSGIKHLSFVFNHGNGPIDMTGLRALPSIETIELDDEVIFILCDHTPQPTSREDLSTDKTLLQLVFESIKESGRSPGEQVIHREGLKAMLWLPEGSSPKVFLHCTVAVYQRGISKCFPVDRLVSYHWVHVGCSR